MGEKQIRNSNIELLRIIAMLGIVLRHMNGYGFLYPEGTYSFNFLLTRCTNYTGNLGNILFMLISGYFLSNASFSWKKWLQIYAELFFYSSLIGIFMYVFKLNYNDTLFNQPRGGLTFEELAIYTNQMDIKNVIKCCMPFIFRRNWFANAYLVFLPFCSIFKHIIKTIK